MPEGFRPEDRESLMIAAIDEITDALSMAELPPGIRLERATDEAGVDRLFRVHELVFGGEESELRASLLAQLASAPETTDLVIAVAGDEPVSAARTDFVAGTEVAGLWGGGTLPRWRRQGIIRARGMRRPGMCHYPPARRPSRDPRFCAKRKRGPQARGGRAPKVRPPPLAFPLAHPKRSPGRCPPARTARTTRSGRRSQRCGSGSERSRTTSEVPLPSPSPTAAVYVASLTSCPLPGSSAGR